MARIPVDATPDVKESIRLLWEEIDRLRGTTVDFRGVRLGGVGYPVQPTDAATKEYVDKKVGG